MLIKDIYQNAGDSSPSSFAAVGNTLYFGAYDTSNGSEIWKSNGTIDSTDIVKDINSTAPGASSFPSSLTVVGNTLYFTANDGVNGNELWKSDANGTVLVKDINTSGDSNPTSLIAAGNTLYFTVFNNDTYYDELWKSDASLGAVLVREINLFDKFHSSLTSVGNIIYFFAEEPYGYSLWKTDGTFDGTEPVFHFDPVYYDYPGSVLSQ